MKQKWLYLSRTAIETERLQCREEGRDISYLEPEFDRVLALDLEDLSNQGAAQSLVDATIAAPLKTDFTSDEEALLSSLCQSQGTEPAAYIRSVIRQELGCGQRQEKNHAAIALLQGWMDEEMPEAESAEAITSWEESMKSLEGREENEKTAAIKF